MGTGAIRLHDDQIRLTAKTIDADHVDSFAASRMKRITNDYFIDMIMGSVLLVRLGEANRTCRRPLD
jgi:TolB-like protein